jgi:hypothetical protein
VKPTNQCDGCRAGMPIINGIHRTEDNRYHVVCSADLYFTIPTEAPNEE